MAQRQANVRKNCDSSAGQPSDRRFASLESEGPESLRLRDIDVEWHNRVQDGRLWKGPSHHQGKLLDIEAYEL